VTALGGGWGSWAAGSIGRSKCDRCRKHSRRGPMATGKVKAVPGPVVWMIRDSGKLGPDERGKQDIDEAISLK
jgi:hypothetical protein